MFSKLSTAAAVLAASTLVSAQTFTECNPLERDCPADDAFGNERVACNLLEGPCDAFHELAGTTVAYTEQGAVFSIRRETEAPTIATDKYIFFGRVDVEIQAAPGRGIVTSAVLQSDCLDEIDWEWVGGDDLQVQTNYFSKGDTSTYDRGAYHPVDHPLTTFHTYSIDWTAERVNWLVDGNVIRTLTYADARGGATFPQTPMQIKLGTWVAGRRNAPEGTVEWAGGYTNFDEAPFLAVYKSISIVDYAGGSGPAEGAVREYIYGDRTGTYESIEVVGGSGSPSNGNEDEETTSSAPTRTSTTTGASSTPAEPTTTSLSTRVRPTTTMTSIISTDAISFEDSSTGSPTGTPSTSTTGPATTPGGDPADDGDDNAPPSAGAHTSVAFGSVMLAGLMLLGAQLL